EKIRQGWRGQRLAQLVVRSLERRELVAAHFLAHRTEHPLDQVGHAVVVIDARAGVREVLVSASRELTAPLSERMRRRREDEETARVCESGGYGAPRGEERTGLRRRNEDDRGLRRVLLRIEVVEELRAAAVAGARFQQMGEGGPDGHPLALEDQ